MPTNYLQKFNQLPDAIKQQVGSPEVVARLEQLETQYAVDQLAPLLIKVCVGEVAPTDLEQVLGERGVAGGAVIELAQILRDLAQPAHEHVSATKSTPRPQGEITQELKDQYTAFIRSDDAQTVHQHMKQVRAELKAAHPGLHQVQLHAADPRFSKAKKRLYAAINHKDKDAFFTSLAEVFLHGNVRRLFQDDQRYIQFWRKRILQQESFKSVHEFDANPAKPAHITRFIRYVMEERFDVSPEQSVLWGVYLSSIAHEVDDTDYEHLAYGDMNTNTFAWDV